MNMDNKTTQLMTKLIRETSSGKIEWKPKDAPKSVVQGTEDIVPLFFEAKYKDKWIALFLRRYKSFYDEHAYYWEESLVFAVLDSADRVLWETSDYSPALRDLFETVREQVAGIDGLLDNLLDDE